MFIFKNFTLFTQEKGNAIGDYPELAIAHNSYANISPLVMDQILLLNPQQNNYSNSFLHLPIENELFTIYCNLRQKTKTCSIDYIYFCLLITRKEGWKYRNVHSMYCLPKGYIYIYM